MVKVDSFLWACKRIADIPWHVRRWTVRRARYLARRIDRWWWGWLRIGDPVLVPGNQCRIDLTVDRHDWRFRVKVIVLLLRAIRLDITVGRWTFPIWGWWQ